GLAGRLRVRPQEAEERSGLTIAGIEPDDTLEMVGGAIDVAPAALDLRGQPKTLYVLRALLQSRADLCPCLVEPPVGERRLRKDEPRGGVVRIARQPLPAQRDRLRQPSRLAIE